MKIAVITGGSSGIGKVAARLFADNGYKVYELSRHGESNGSIIHVTCDVTQRESCSKSIDNIIEENGKIDVLIGNAGMGISGAVEFTDITEAKRQFEVNFFGAVNIAQTVLPYMRNMQYGKIIFVSSLAAEFPIPYQGFYSASKAAINSVACAMRNEVRPFGIHVSCLLPGDVQTGFTSARTKINAGCEVYTRMNNAVKAMEHDEQHGVSAQLIARKLLKMAEAKRMPMYSTVGLKYKLIVFFNKLLPKTFVNRVVGKIYG
jgi:short-subunit dehydrogenase